MATQRHNKLALRCVAERPSTTICKNRTHLHPSSHILPAYIKCKTAAAEPRMKKVKYPRDKQLTQKNSPTNVSWHQRKGTYVGAAAVLTVTAKPSAECVKWTVGRLRKGEQLNWGNSSLWRNKGSREAKWWLVANSYLSCHWVGQAMSTQKQKKWEAAAAAHFLVLPKQDICTYYSSGERQDAKSKYFSTLKGTIKGLLVGNWPETDV